MIRSKSIAGPCLIALVACAGCSSGGSSDSAFSQQNFDQLMQQVVIPSLQLLNPFPGSGSPLATARAVATAAPGTLAGGAGCPVGTADLSPDYCQTGLACQANNAGTLTTTFSDCVAQGATINGTWVVVGGPDINTSTLNLTVSVLSVVIATLQGTIDAVVSGDCVEQSLGTATPLVVQAGGTTVEFDGLLEYCSTSSTEWPSGTRSLSVTESGSDLLYVMTFDATNVVTTVINDLSSGTTVETCDTNLDTGVSTCVEA